jgi:Kef-type K+ transport system membrane component KefB
LSEAFPSLPISDPVAIVAIATILFLVAPVVAERARMPGILGIILGGAVFGPNMLGLLERDATIVLLGTVGLLYLVFLAGLELDLHRFARYRRQSIVFGLLSFGVPMAMAVGVMPLLGFNIPASVLVGAIVGSHTLLAYPIASRLGLISNRAVTVIVGGTLVTDTLSLAVLAVVSGVVSGGLGFAFWVRLVLGLAVYVGIVWWGVPKLGRWFYRRAPGQPSAEFLFLLAVLFTSAFAARLGGAQPIIGAFLAGLALNRLIPNDGPSMSRVRFVGNALFIPFFLLSVGMLVDPAVLAGSSRVWLIAGALTVLVHLGKFAGMWATRSIYGYSRDEALVGFGLSVPQAAATLAVTFVGLEIGLFDEDVVNGVVLLIVLSCVVGPYFVERFGPRVALSEELKPFDPLDRSPRIMVPMANPATANDLMDLALLLREPGSREPIYPVTVVPSEMDRSEEHVAAAEKMLGHAVAHAAAADAPVVPVTRMDHNFANGISRAVAETRSSILIVGWDGRRSPRRVVFGTVLDQLLDLTRQQILVAKLGHPVVTTRRIVLLVPQGSDHLPGFPEAVRTIKRMAGQLGATIAGFTVRGQPESYLAHFERLRPNVPTSFEWIGGWDRMMDRLQLELRDDDLVMVIGARRGAVSWVSALERLPGVLSRLVPESFIMLYPSEAISASDPQRLAGVGGIPRSLAAERVLLAMPSRPFREVLSSLLATAYGENTPRLREMERVVFQSDGLSWEMLPGVVVPHVRIAGLDDPILFLGVYPEGVHVPDVEEPARLIFLLLTPEDRPDEHLAELSGIAALVSDPERVQAITLAATYPELEEAVEGADTVWRTG